MDSGMSSPYGQKTNTSMNPVPDDNQRYHRNPVTATSKNRISLDMTQPSTCRDDATVAVDLTTESLPQRYDPSNEEAWKVNDSVPNPNIGSALINRVVNPSLLEGSQRVKAIKRLAAQRKRRYTKKKKSSISLLPLVCNTETSQTDLRNTVHTTDSTETGNLSRRISKLKSTIKLMEAAVRQKEKEKILIVDLINSQKKELKELIDELTTPVPEEEDEERWPCEIENKVSSKRPVKKRTISSNAPKSDGKSAQKVLKETGEVCGEKNTTRKRGRPPLDPCYPCPSKETESSKSRKSSSPFLLSDENSNPFMTEDEMQEIGNDYIEQEEQDYDDEYYENNRK